MTRLIMMIMTRSFTRIEAVEFDISNLHPTMSRDSNTFQLQKYHFSQCFCVMNYSSLVCLDDFHPNPISENLRHRFILCKLTWKLRVSGKFDWQVLVIWFNHFSISRYSRYFFGSALQHQIAGWTSQRFSNYSQQQTDQIKESNLLHQTTNWTNQPTNQQNKETNKPNKSKEPTCSAKAPAAVGRHWSLMKKIKHKHFSIWVWSKDCILCSDAKELMF